MKFGVGVLGKKLSLKCEFHDNWPCNGHTVHKDVNAFLRALTIISHWSG